VPHRWALGKEKKLKILCRVPLCAALGKEKKFKNSLPSAPLRGNRQRKKNLKILCRVPLCVALGKEIFF
jgi:hypothetical protein